MTKLNKLNLLKKSLLNDLLKFVWYIKVLLTQLPFISPVDIYPGQGKSLTDF